MGILNWHAEITSTMANPAKHKRVRRIVDFMIGTPVVIFYGVACHN
jgi:hypothetical protein